MRTRPLVPVGALGCLLGHRTIGRPVQVEVVSEHELGASHGRALDDGLRQRREQLGPLRVIGLHAVVDDGSAFARSPSALNRPHVRRHVLDVIGQVDDVAPRNGAHRQCPRGELPDNCGAGATGSAKDDMTLQSHRLTICPAGETAGARPPLPDTAYVSRLPRVPRFRDGGAAAVTWTAAASISAPAPSARATRTVAEMPVSIEVVAGWGSTTGSWWVATVSGSYGSGLTDWWHRACGDACRPEPSMPDMGTPRSGG